MGLVGWVGGEKGVAENDFSGLFKNEKHIANVIRCEGRMRAGRGLGGWFSS